MDWKTSGAPKTRWCFVSRCSVEDFLFEMTTLEDSSHGLKFEHSTSDLFKLTLRYFTESTLVRVSDLMKDGTDG